MKATAGRAAIAVALGVAVLGGGGPAWGASGSKTSFTVDTQFLDAPSEIVAATGPLAACTAVESTLPGVSSGGGTLKGDNRSCTLLPDSGGCILDGFVTCAECMPPTRTSARGPSPTCTIRGGAPKLARSGVG